MGGPRGPFPARDRPRRLLSHLPVSPTLTHNLTAFILGQDDELIFVVVAVVAHCHLVFGQFRRWGELLFGGAWGGGCGGLLDL